MSQQWFPGLGAVQMRISGGFQNPVMDEYGVEGDMFYQDNAQTYFHQNSAQTGMLYQNDPINMMNQGQSNMVYQNAQIDGNPLVDASMGHPFPQVPQQEMQNVYNTKTPSQLGGLAAPAELGQRAAISAPTATHSTGQILSDQDHLSPYYPPHATYPANMTTVGIPSQLNTFHRDDSGIDSHNQGASLAQFRHFSNADAQDFKGRMNSIDAALSPAAASAAPPGKVPIPPLARTDSEANAGPLGKSWEVKPRPKPGRKPMSDDPSNKRKQQNRHAQRAFRDRRAQKVHDLEIEVQEMKRSHEEELSRSKQEAVRQQSNLDGCHQLIAQLQAEVARLQEQNDQLRRDQESAKSHAHHSANHHQHTVSTSNSVSSLLTPPSEDNNDMEIDFTQMFSRGKQPTFTSVASPIGTDDHCGFCTEAENCICRQQEEINKSLPPMDPSRATQNPALPSDGSTPKFLEAPTTATGPGTCDMCLADPEKARQCRELAQSTQFSSIGTVPLSKPKDPRHVERTTCSDFFSLARQNNVQLGPENYARIAHIYPYSSERPGHSPAMEMDREDAALALTKLSQDTRLS